MNLKSFTSLYNELILGNVLTHIPTHALSQDHLEVSYVKIYRIYELSDNSTVMVEFLKTNSSLYIISFWKFNHDRRIATELIGWFFLFEMIKVQGWSEPAG